MASSSSSSSSSSLIQGGSLPSFSAIRLRHSSSAHSFLCLTKLPDNSLRSSGYRRMACTAMVQQAVHGAPAIYAKEMERLSAKESLLLAFKDSGGFEALVTGKTTDMQRIDVNERINGLERLNPTPRPTTSPFLEGRWSFEWFGAGSPGLFAARFISERFPKTFADLSKMDMVIKDGNAKVTANMKLLYSIESKFILLSKLTVEGPLRMKEEYVEGILETPTIIEETVPEQLKGAFGQAVHTVQQLPVPIRDSFSSGLKIPLTSTFQRLFMISYLDDEILKWMKTAHRINLPSESCFSSTSRVVFAHILKGNNMKMSKVDAIFHSHAIIYKKGALRILEYYLLYY